MHANQATIDPGRDPTAPRMQLETLLVCDIVDSTGLIGRLGDAAAAALLRRHEDLVRSRLGRFGGTEMGKSDGFLLMFDHPSDAVDFALDYQHALRTLETDLPTPLQARVGIHFGEVLVDRDAPGEGGARLGVEGPARVLAHGLMRLARPGQILISGVVRDLARRRSNALDPGLPKPRWCEHGRYRVPGEKEPVAVHEVGLPGATRFEPPPNDSIAGRQARRWRRLVLALPLLALGLAALAMVAGLLRPTTAIAFRERDWVVVGSLSNMTGDPRFDDALETALRIGLEQSRHLNVLPDLRVREALQRMGRPGDTAIDRAIGSEIALRENARALMLPSITEVGGRVRVSIELVDPHSQRTVMTESALARGGANSALEALDHVKDRLRHSLGESIEAIEIAREPMERVASPSLDALRAYTLGMRAYSTIRWDEARIHFENALSLDPDFALAHVALGRYHYGRDEFAQAMARWQTALTLGERLSERELLGLKGLISMVSHERDFPARWRALVDLYPDQYTAVHNYAISMWYANRYEEGAVFAERATAPQSITRPQSSYTLGYLLLGANRPEEAIAAFQRAEALGRSGRTSVMAAAAHAARRDFDVALRTLERETADSPVQAKARQQLRLVMAVDAGAWDQLEQHEVALSLANDPMAEEAIGLSGRLAPWALRHLGERAGRTALTRFDTDLAHARALLGQATLNDRDLAGMAVLYAAYVAADVGREALARTLLAEAEPLLAAAPFPSLANMHALVEARLLLDADNPAAALQALGRWMEGDELYLTRVLVARAHAALGQHEEALREERWLASQRGRAYAEYSGGHLLQAENVLESNLALLRVAELALQLQDPQAAMQAFTAFRAAWPTLPDAPGLAGRVAAVAAALSYE